MRHAFATEVEANRHWTEGPIRKWSPLAKAPDTLYRVAEYMGDSFVDAKFRLFQNGGLPQLERRRNLWIQELLIRPSELNLGECLRFRIEFCLSHPAVRHIREMYWKPASRAPIGVSHGNIGELDLPPSFLSWTTSGGIEDLQDAATKARQLALPWFRAFDHEDDLEDALLGQGLPMIGHADALDLLVAFGKISAARKYLRTFLVCPQFESLWERAESFGVIPVDTAPDIVRSAIVARTFNLA